MSAPGGTPDETCKACGRSIAPTDWTCPHCGATRWGMVLGVTVFGLLGIGAVVAPQTPLWLRIVGGVLGIPFLLVGVAEIWTGLRAGRAAEVVAPVELAGAPARKARDRREFSASHWTAVGATALAVAGAALAVVWNGQAGTAAEERDALLDDIAAAEATLEGIDLDITDLRDDLAALEAQIAAAGASAEELERQAVDLDAAVADRRSVFEQDTADEVDLAETLAAVGDLIEDLVRSDRAVAADLDEVAGQFGRAVNEGNIRNVTGLEARIAPETLDGLSGDLEAALAALESAAGAVETLPALEEAADGG